MKSKRTKQCKTRSIVFNILHLLCLLGPFLYFIPYAYIVGTMVSKVTLSLAIIVGLLLGAYVLIADAKMRGGLTKTIIWILLIGVAVCLAEVEVFLYIMASVSILDELVIVRIRDKYRAAFIANREIDRRG